MCIWAQQWLVLPDSSSNVRMCTDFNIVLQGVAWYCCLLSGNQLCCRGKGMRQIVYSHFLVCSISKLRFHDSCKQNIFHLLCSFFPSLSPTAVLTSSKGRTLSPSANVAWMIDAVVWKTALWVQRHTESILVAVIPISYCNRLFSITSLDLSYCSCRSWPS